MHSATIDAADKLPAPLRVFSVALATQAHYHAAMNRRPTPTVSSRPSAASILLAILFATLSGAASAELDFPATALEGSWEGPLVIGRDNMQLAFTFAFDEPEFEARMTSSGLGIYGMPAPTVMVDGRNIIIRIPRLDLEFTGTVRLGDDGQTIERIDGDWFQYSEMVPVILRPVDEPSF